MSEVLRNFTDGPFLWSRPSLQLLRGMATGEALGMVKKTGESLAPKFWGVDQGLSIAPIPNKLPNKVLWLQKTLRSMPGLHDELQQTAQWNVDELIKQSKRSQSHKLKLSAKTHSDVPSLTLVEAFRIPALKSQLHGSLQVSGDPVVYTVEVFDQWRIDKRPYVEQAHLDMGRLAFETFIFGHHGPVLQQRLGEIAMHTDPAILIQQHH